MYAVHVSRRQARSQTMHAVGATASCIAVYTYVCLYKYIMLYCTYTVYIYYVYVV